MRIGNPFRRVQAEKQGQASAGGCNRLIKKGIPLLELPLLELPLLVAAAG